MPRQSRLVVPNVAVHIIQRGNNRAPCFLGESDYQVYLLHLKQLAAKLECLIHAYCLMTNHVHLLVTPAAATSCTSLMRNLGQRYVQYFNKRHRRTGTLWEGRFRSCVVESARYVIACYRYIEMNPVRAGLVAVPGAYRWSSHLANTGERADALISPHPEFLALAIDDVARRTAYRRLFEGDADDAVIRMIRESTNGGYPLGSELFNTSVSGSTARRLKPGKAGRPSKRDGEGKHDSSPEIGL